MNLKQCNLRCRKFTNEPLVATLTFLHVLVAAAFHRNHNHISALNPLCTAYEGPLPHKLNTNLKAVSFGQEGKISKFLFKKPNYISLREHVLKMRADTFRSIPIPFWFTTKKPKWMF